MYKFAKLLQSNCISLPKIQKKSDRIYITNSMKSTHISLSIIVQIYKKRYIIYVVTVGLYQLFIYFCSLSSCHSPISCSLFSSLSAYQTPHLLLGLFNIFSLHTRFPLLLWFFKNLNLFSRMNSLLK